METRNELGYKEIERIKNDSLSTDHRPTIEVYTISHHVFFAKNNHEYATAFYPPEDLQVYANLSAAMTKISEKIVSFSSTHKMSIKLPKEEQVIENGYSYVSFKYTLSGTEYREVFVITKKELL